MIEDRDYHKQELADLMFPNTDNPKSRLKACVACTGIPIAAVIPDSRLSRSKNSSAVTEKEKNNNKFVDFRNVLYLCSG